jgi:hypothetical protein
VLRDHGIGLDDVRLDPGAWTAATVLGQELGVTTLFPDLPNARPGIPGPGHGPAPSAGPAQNAGPAPSPTGGHPLGPMSEWKIETSGAVLTFVTQAGDHTYPAVVLRSPPWRDPGPARDLVAEHRRELDDVNSLARLVSFVRDVAAKERAYLDASGVATTYNNERYRIQEARRHTWFEALAGAASRLAVPAAERARVAAVLAAERERLVCDRDYDMETGSHTNYWPYWRNFRWAIEKLLHQTAPGTDEYFSIKNRLEDIYDHKTMFAHKRRIDEKDLEASIGGALVHRGPFSTTSGHRVSLAHGSYSTAPIYEVLSVASSGLPAELEHHAGAHVYRDTDAAETLRFDPGGATIPDALQRHVQARRIDPSELGLRPLMAGETARARIPGDWNRNGGVEIAPIEVDWWGHCHNQAPLDAMGVDPKRAVTLYRSGRGIPAAQAMQSFTANDVWDLFGALTADHEAGYATRDSFGMREAQVESTQFVGSRNEGGHWLLLELVRPGARRVRIDAEVTQLWHKSEPSEKYASPAERFRRDLPNDDGAFDPNPDWIAAEVSDDREITIDCLGRRLTLIARYITFDGSGERHENKVTVELNPAKDAWVKIAEEIVRVEPRGGTLAEHWYNAAQARYYRAIVEVAADGRRSEAHRDEAIPVARAMAQQESEYDSVIDIHDFVTRNMGLPFVFDTSSGLAVWNYPVNHVRIDRIKDVDRVEGGKTFTYTSYRLRYTTVGGPDDAVRYLIKRDEDGNAVRALALDPMPDFGFRNESWVCAPAISDPRGNVAFNVHALEAGYLTDKRRAQIVPELWRRQAAICYASLGAPGGGHTVYVFEQRDGELLVFPDAASFQAAVDADRRDDP